MPELPEVETIVRGLRESLDGATVLRLLHVSPHLLKREPQLRQLAGDTFASFERRGKYIIAHLTSGRRLMIHLRMSGRILVGEDRRREDRHDHLEITFCHDANDSCFVMSASSASYNSCAPIGRVC